MRRLEFVLKIADDRFQREHPRFEIGDAGIAFAATGALGDIHPTTVTNSRTISCASLRTVNGYDDPTEVLACRGNRRD
jgi:hypothetical protein